MLNRFDHFMSAISEISLHWHRIAAAEMETYGLKGPHAVYLSAISQCTDGVTAAQLCELCGKDKSDVSRTMSALIEKGLVRKESGPTTCYHGVFRLTKEGRTAAEHVCQRACLAVELAGKGLTNENRAAFYEALDLIVLNLRKISKNGLPDPTTHY